MLKLKNTKMFIMSVSGVTQMSFRWIVNILICCHYQKKYSFEKVYWESIPAQHIIDYSPTLVTYPVECILIFIFFSPTPYIFLKFQVQNVQIRINKVISLHEFIRHNSLCLKMCYCERKLTSHCCTMQMHLSASRDSFL